jgi:hypothetical protein
MAYILTLFWVSGAVPSSVDLPSVSGVASGVASGLSFPSAIHTFRSRVPLPVVDWGNRARDSFFHNLTATSKQTTAFLEAIWTHVDLSVKSALRQLESSAISSPSLRRSVLVGFTAVIPAASLIYSHEHLNRRAAKRRAQVGNLLQLAILTTVARDSFSAQDLCIALLLIMSMEALRRSLSRTSCHRALALHASPDVDNIAAHAPGIEYEGGADASRELDNASADHASSNSSCGEHHRHHKAEHIRDALKLSCDSLSEAGSENTHSQDTVKTKDTIERDRQATLYRKHIELFALRKSNQQKENLIKERNTMLGALSRQHQASLEQRDARIHALEYQLATLAQPDSPQDRHETDCNGNDGRQAAVKLKVLRIKGRKSQDHYRELEEKDVEISRLKEDIMALQSGSETYTRLQDELRRAWEATHETQGALNEERRNHARTINKLQETAIRLEEEIRKSQKSSPARLPTIEESDKRELEAMFNAAQEDNLRLYAELETAEKRLREANQRLFTDEQELVAVKEQLRLEKAINADMDTARPSLVHRVHFQRMEGQLKEARDALDLKAEEIEQLRATNMAKDAHIMRLKAAIDTDRIARTALEAELERVKKLVADLEATKEQLMLGHERLARSRTRNRETSKDLESSRFSGATLITDSNYPLPHTTGAAPTQADPDVPDNLRPVIDTGRVSSSSNAISSRSSITDPVFIPVTKQTDEGHDAVASLPIPMTPTDNRQSRRKSLTFKGLMRKMAGKDAKESKSMKPNDEKRDIYPRPALALAPKDKNAPVRPRTSAAQTVVTGISKEANAGLRPRSVASQAAFGNGEGQQQIGRARSAVQQRGPQRDVENGLRRPRSAIHQEKANMGNHEDAGVIHPGPDPGMAEGAPIPAQRPTTAHSEPNRQARLPTIRVWTGNGHS